jgi:hypothetical protein
MIEPAARAAGTGRPRAELGPQVEFHSRRETLMTRRETRKLRSERRARIGTECLETRNLLSGLGSITTAQLASVPPSGSYQTALIGGTESVAQLKYTFEAPSAVPGSYQTSLVGGTESVAYFKQDKPQTALWGAAESSSLMKITGPHESVAYFKQDKPQTALWGETGPSWDLTKVGK